MLQSNSNYITYVGGEEEVKAQVKMIDFAHVWPLNEEERDEGYFDGLKNFIRMLQDIVDT